MQMQFRVVVYKKKGYLTYGESEADKLVLLNSLISIKINKARDTSTSEATIVAEFEHLPMAAYQGGDSGIIDNYAFMEIYFDEDIQFTGIIKKYIYNENDKTITLTCHDMMYRLLNTTSEPLVFTNQTAVDIIIALANKVGLTVSFVGGENYTITELKIDEGTTVLDVIQNMLETMHAIIRCTKNGVVQIEEQYPNYTEGAGDANHFDWTYTSPTNTSTAEAGRDATEMKNILRVICNNNYTKFEEPSMTDYLNGEYWYNPDIENAVADTPTKRKAVAGYLYLDMWRNSTPLTILPVKGQKGHDMGQVVKLLRENTVPGYYLVVGIDTEVTAEGYMDTLQLQGMRDKYTIYNIPKVIAEGVIDPKQKTPTGKPKEDVSFKIYTGDIASVGYNELGYIDVPADTPVLMVSMTCLDVFNDGKTNYGITAPDLDIIDPNGIEYGNYGKVAPFCPSVSNPVGCTGYGELSDGKSAGKITYSGMLSNPETWYIYSPVAGRWRIKAYSFCDTTHPTNLNITAQCNLAWTIVNHTGQTSI